MREISFQRFESIESIKHGVYLEITQKLHGTNGAIFYSRNPEHIAIGSRNRWLTETEDNHGFYKFVHENLDALKPCLKEGYNYGEFIGKGIGNGEGLTEKNFAFFDFHHFGKQSLPHGFSTVPVLFVGKMGLSKLNEKINECLDDLKTNGSKYTPGFMKPEGIVVKINHVRFKLTFENEETQWKVGDPIYRAEKDRERSRLFEEIKSYLQPLRLEKLLLKEERLTRDYPKTISEVITVYCDDLIQETPGISLNPEQMKILGNNVAKMFREMMSVA